jgi:hypothetical protein
MLQGITKSAFAETAVEKTVGKIALLPKNNLIENAFQNNKKIMTL